jgi:hypothetical protein
MNIEMLFPEICCLYGDLANVTYLERCVPDCHVVRTSLKAEPAFLSSLRSHHHGSMTRARRS